MDLTWAHVFPVATLVLGAWLAAWFAERSEWRRWRRDYFLQQIAARQVFFGDVLEAMHDQHRVSGQCGDAVRGLRPGVPQARVENATQRWNRVLARGGVSVGREVQEAMSAFDRARAEAAEAINGGDEARIVAALDSLDRLFAATTVAMNAEVAEINEELGGYVRSGRDVAWRRLTRQPLGPYSSSDVAVRSRSGSPNRG